MGYGVYKDEDASDVADSGWARFSLMGVIRSCDHASDAVKHHPLSNFNLQPCKYIYSCFLVTKETSVTFKFL